jgi:hypothetical protein
MALHGGRMINGTIGENYNWFVMFSITNFSY